jgi:hypothetical protein
MQFPKRRVCSFFLVTIKIRTMDKVQKPSNSVCYTPSSEPYRIYMSTCIFNLHGVDVHIRTLNYVDFVNI